MIKIRSNIFETNSSSTHSLSIYHEENNEFTDNLIPKNSIIKINNCYNPYDEIKSPMDKLKALIEYIGNYYNEYQYCNNRKRYLYGKEVLFFVLLKNLIATNIIQNCFMNQMIIHLIMTMMRLIMIFQNLELLIKMIMMIFMLNF